MRWQITTNHNNDGWRKECKRQWAPSVQAFTPLCYRPLCCLPGIIRKDKLAPALVKQVKVSRTTSFSSNGHVHHEFNLRISSYLKRNKLERRGLPQAQIDSILHPRAGIGIYTKLIGDGSMGKIHLKLFALLYVKVFVQRDDNVSFLQQDIQFKKVAKEENLMIDVTWEVYALKGGATAYVEILIINAAASLQRCV